MKPILTILAVAAFAATTHAQQLVPLDQTSRDLAELDRNVQGASYYLSLYIQSLNRIQAFYSLQDERLEAALNKVGPEGVSRLVALQTAAAQGANAIAAAGGLDARAAEQPSRNWTWVNGEVVLEPLPEPETAE